MKIIDENSNVKLCNCCAIKLNDDTQAHYLIKRNYVFSLLREVEVVWNMLRENNTSLRRSNKKFSATYGTPLETLSFARSSGSNRELSIVD
jgi:hypothetical protein